jgi:oxysterol-binding protein 1
MAYVMAFALTPYASTINRLKKPFNPLLGETFELINEEKKFKFIAE